MRRRVPELGPGTKLGRFSLLEALASLRTHIEPVATDTLLAHLDDEDPDVAARALMVLRKRHYEGKADPALVERATTGKYNE